MILRILKRVELYYLKIWILLYRSENRVSTHLTLQEKYQLFKLTTACRGNIYVEIGSYLGASSCFIAAGIKKSTGGMFYCVDTWQNDTMPEGKRDTFDEFTQNTQKYSYIIVPLRGRSEVIAKNFFKKIDFLFIDGDHSYEGVKADVDAWFPKLNLNSLVVFHDIAWAAGVQCVVHEQVKPLAKKEGQLPNLYWAWI